MGAVIDLILGIVWGAIVLFGILFGMLVFFVVIRELIEERRKHSHE